MFRKFVISVMFGVLMLSSLALVADDGSAPVKLAVLEVENQLSVSAHQGGEQSFIQQVKPAEAQAKKDVSIPVVTGFWLMMFGLFLFVLRGGGQRI
jgi:hypothetical protein